jgi:hypothetical protein
MRGLPIGDASLKIRLPTSLIAFRTTAPGATPLWAGSRPIEFFNRTLCLRVDSVPTSLAADSLALASNSISCGA